MKNRLLYFILLLALSADLQAQTVSAGTRFWLGYMESIDLLFNGSPEFGIQVSSYSSGTGSIEVPGTGLEIPFEFNAGTNEIMLPDAIWYSQVTEQIEDKGVLITTDVPVELTALHYRIYFCDGSRILPETALTSEYTVLAARDFNSNSPSAMVIVSTQDGTVVEITPSTLTQGLHPPGITFSITLDEGQIYQILASNDLTGTYVQAVNGEKLAVFAGAKQADVYCAADDSHLWDQVLPYELWGNDYLFIPYQGGGGDVFKVLALEDNTQLNLNCNEETQTLNAGESLSFFRTQYTRMHSDKPVQVAHMSTSSSCSANDAGPSFVIVTPLNRRAQEMQWFASDNIHEDTSQPYFTDHYIHMVIESSESDNVLLDGNPVSFSELSVYPGMSAARVQVDPGAHSISSSYPLWAEAAGFSFAEAYTFNMNWDQDLPAAQVELVAITGPTGSDFCVGEDVFFNYEFGIDLFDGVWDMGDGATVSGEAISYVYDEEGEYIVTFTANDDQGCPYTGYMTIQILDCTNSISENVLVDMQAYIAQNKLEIRNAPGNAVCTYELYNELGQLLQSKQSPARSFQMDLTGLARGIYVLNVQADDMSVQFKLLKD